VNHCFTPYRIAVLIACIVCACGSDKRPKNTGPAANPPVDAQDQTPDADEPGEATPSDATTGTERADPPPSKPVDVERLVESMVQYLEPCAQQLLMPKLMHLERPSPAIYDSLAEHCNLTDKIFPESTDAAIGVARSVDEALLAYAGLDAEVQHLRVLVGGALDIPSQAFHGELDARLKAVKRTISNSRNTIRRARKDLTAGALGDDAVQALPVLVREPRLFLDTVASLVDASVIGPPRQTMIRDVRTRLLKGRPIAFTQDRISIRVARSRFRKVAGVLRQIALNRPSYNQGLSKYIAAVEAYLGKLDEILRSMKAAQTYDQRADIMKQLKRLTRYERKEVTTRLKFWRANIEDALLIQDPKPNEP